LRFEYQDLKKKKKLRFKKIKKPRKLRSGIGAIEKLKNHKIRI